MSDSRWSCGLHPARLLCPWDSPGRILDTGWPVQFSRPVVSNSLWPHEPQHTRPSCPSPIPGAYPKSCPLSRWCHPTISSSAIPFSCLQSFPASGSFPVSQLFASGDQSIGVSVSTSVLPVNTQDWSPLGRPGQPLICSLLLLIWYLAPSHVISCSRVKLTVTGFADPG